MREILFRGKTIKESFAYGLLSHIGNAWYISNKAGSPKAYEVIPNTIGQYTGLVDKNGKKIFEGDIVDYEDEAPGQYEYHDSLIINRGVIEYSEGCFYWTNAVNANLLDSVYKGVADCEVIGNIFDNPELLTED